MSLRELLAEDAHGSGAVASLRASVLEHLRAMCGTRRGTVEGRPDYGLPDVSEMVHSFPRAIADMQAALEHTVATYEPRLAHVRVTHLPSAPFDLVLRFEIAASLREHEGAAPVRFETRVDASRGVSVE
ncbi:MAG TPA: type VI secretion system baseplate subunit TssE [Polyangiaceae bacterium]